MTPERGRSGAENAVPALPMLERKSDFQRSNKHMPTKRNSDFQPPQSDRYNLRQWRRVVAKAEDAERYQPRAAEETAVLTVLTILLWVMGLTACFVLAWQGTGGSVIVTGIILLLPIGAWRIFGMSRWGLILPISLIAALALQGALLLA
jgi:hypothetical protein